MKRMKLSNRLSYTILGVVIMILLGVGVYAYGTSDPSTFGHDAGELEGVCKSDGVGCPEIPFYGADTRFTINAEDKLCFDTASTGSCELQNTACNSHKFITFAVSDTVCGNSFQQDLACDIQCASTIVCDGDVTPFSCGATSVVMGTSARADGCVDNVLSCDCSSGGASDQREVGLNQRCI